MPCNENNNKNFLRVNLPICTHFGRLGHTLPECYTLQKERRQKNALGNGVTYFKYGVLGETRTASRLILSHAQA